LIQYSALTRAATGRRQRVSSLVLEQRWQRAAVGASFSLSLGAAKELYDMHGGGQASGRDMAWNIIGTATGVGLAWVADIRW
jgi:putative lipoprotein